MADDSISAAVDAFLANQQMKNFQSYLDRGRGLKEEPLDKLSARWVELMRVWAGMPDLKMDHTERLDIEGELKMRGLEPPKDAAQDSLSAIQEKMKELERELRADPERRRKLGRSILEDFFELQDEADTKPKN